MEPLQNITTQRNSWKALVADDLEVALETVISNVKNHSARSDEILAMLGQYRQLETDNQKGILRYEEWLLQINRLRHQLLDWLDGLQPTDLGWTTDPLKGTPPPTPLVSDLSPLDRLIEIDENEREVVSFFPKIYRALRQQIIRADQMDPTNAGIVKSLEEALPVLRSTRKDLHPLYQYRRQIQLHTSEPNLWRETKRLFNLVGEIELENWSSLTSRQEAIRGLRNNLQTKGLIPPAD